MVKNCVIGQSGGPTAVINASLCGIICGAHKNEKIDKIYGCLNGISGLLKENFIELNEIAETPEKLELVKITPAAYLGSCRYRLPNDADVETYENIFKIFEKYNIGYFFYIGGNDSMDTVGKLSAYAKKNKIDVKIIGIPKTIDNDLLETDHTPGFGSAAKYIASTMREIGIDIGVYNLKSVTVVEIMGRDAGWLTASSALARDCGFAAPHLIYLPECDFSDEKFISDINSLHEKGINNLVVAVSEGIKYKDGTYVCEGASTAGTDAFGNKILSGTAKVLENLIKREIGCKARGIELNLPQRCAGHMLSLTDINEAFAVGIKGVEAATEGVTGKMMAYKRIGNNPYSYEIEYADINKVIMGTSSVPEEWIVNGNDVSKELIEYVNPLIQGEIPIVFKSGVPVYANRNDA